MYNIYHGSIMSEDKVVIDSNARIKSRIEQAEKKALEERHLRQRAQIDEFISHLSRDDEGLPVLEKNDDGTYVIPLTDDGKPLFDADENGHPVITEEDEHREEAFTNEISLQESEEQRDAIIKKAEEDAEAIIAKAKEEADGLFEHTADEASKKGYSDGLVQGQQEYQKKLDELSARSAELENDYKQRAASIEESVLDTVLDVVSKAFDIEFSDDSGLLLSRIDDCLNHIENSKEILVRVNDSNYSRIQSEKDKITEKLGEGVNVEFAKDPLLGDGDGMIETDGGVYDVSIDTEFKNLIKKIRLLSI